MSRTPMPSPNGTNREGAYLPSGSRVVAAYDAKPDTSGPDDGDWSALLGFLEDKLDDGDLRKVRYMLGLDHPDFQDHTSEGASDAARRRTYAADAQALYARGHITAHELERRVIAGPPRKTTEAERRAFDERFPHAGRLKVL